ncbi:hypothetical protein MRB53_010381 [Persea americana]|uniref:Uncharacterized protein n=1 Tax=Persea americana TaxID=3435 RepID=A0ACC2LRN6_PERAE|nr:hypothetical protein MRB53_010381 [Persea americana]
MSDRMDGLLRCADGLCRSMSQGVPLGLLAGTDVDAAIGRGRDAFFGRVVYCRLFTFFGRVAFFRRIPYFKKLINGCLQSSLAVRIPILATMGLLPTQSAIASRVPKFGINRPFFYKDFEIAAFRHGHSSHDTGQGISLGV